MSKETSSKVPKNETPEARFKRVVTPRVNRAVKNIGFVGNCAGSGYKYSKEQADKIVSTLRKAVDTVAAKFAGKKETQQEFTL